MREKGLNHSEIARQLNIRRATVIQWLAEEQYEDERGWRKGTARKYTDEAIAGRICTLKRKRIDDHRYFLGSEHVRMDYATTYPKEDLPSKWYIDKVVRQADLQTRKPKEKKRGGAKYLLYPQESIRTLGQIHQSADFIGKKYIAGSREPISIFSSSYYAPFKLYRIARTEAEKAGCAIAALAKQWRQYPVPDVFRMDNGLQFRGTASGKRVVGMFLRFLLNLRITPLFGSPSKPWTNPHVEGHNRVFNEKVWNRHFFENREQIDRACDAFNAESAGYFHWRYARMMENCHFRYLEDSEILNTDALSTTKNKKVYFIRFAESLDQDTNAFIVILNETIHLPEQYAHQFVFAEWDIERGLLNIFSECEKQVSCIKRIKFPMNV